MPNLLASGTAAVAPIKIPAGGVPADNTLSERDFIAVAGLIHRETGILITAAKKSMLVSRLSRRLRHLGLSRFSDYVALLEAHDGEEERKALISAVTTNVTGFFREPHHFKVLAGLAPGLIARARAGGRVRLWSAGCSTGQEAFSIAATLLGLAPDLARYDLRVLATDIDPAVIEIARLGVFDRQSLGDNQADPLARFLENGPRADQVSLSPLLQGLIRFEVLNLLGSWPFQGQFDVIFCRNVVIYFDVPTRQALWTRFAAQMPKDGTLFIGHSERIDPEVEPFFTPAGLTQYRRTGIPAKSTEASPSTKARP